jgi:hypothetical protein
MGMRQDLFDIVWDLIFIFATAVSFGYLVHRPAAGCFLFFAIVTYLVLRRR